MLPRELINALWKPRWSAAPAFRRLTAAREQILAAYRQMDETAASVAADRKAGLLSAKGIQERAREVAALAIVPRLRRATLAAKTATAELEATIASLAVAAPDPADAAGAIRRMEIRSLLRNLTPGDLATHLTATDAPLDVLQAVFEVPAWVSGVDPEMQEIVQTAILQSTKADEMAVIEEIGQAIDLISSAALMAQKEIGALAGFESIESHVYKAWFDQVAVETDREVEAEEQTAPPLSAADLRFAADVMARAEAADREKLRAHINTLILAKITGENVANPVFG